MASRTTKSNRRYEARKLAKAMSGYLWALSSDAERFADERAIPIVGARLGYLYHALDRLNELINIERSIRDSRPDR